MTLLAEREHARTDLVAAAHSLRLVIVTVSIPLPAMGGIAGRPGPDAAQRAHRAMARLCLAGAGHWRGGIADAQAQACQSLVSGALAVSMGLTMAGLELSAVPQWLMNAAQLVIGVSLGCADVSSCTAPRWLGMVALGTVGLMAVCAGFAWLLHWGTGLPWVTLLLGTSPGGITEMAITARCCNWACPWSRPSRSAG
jgi:uncharacterized membrane protein AbrB (regulator of aidB expression)